MRELKSFYVGESARIRVQVPADAVDRFAELSGDAAPIHMDDEFARASGFQGRLIHGAYLSALVSRFVGMTLPGAGAVLERIDLTFRAPCYAPCEVAIEGRVRQMSEAVSSIVLEVTISGEGGKTIASGKTWHRVHSAGTA